MQKIRHSSNSIEELLKQNEPNQLPNERVPRASQGDAEDVPLLAHKQEKLPDCADGIEAEVEAYSAHLNLLLSGFSEELKNYLPLCQSNFFANFRDGVLLAYMIYNMKPSAIDIKQIAVNLDMSTLNKPHSKVVFEASANHNLVLQTAKEIGIKVVNIGSQDIMNQKKSLVLGLVWQMVRSYLLSKIDLVNHPELIRLMKTGETLDQLFSCTSEQILLRWFNYHLERCNFSKTITNFSTDVSDSEAYFLLIQQTAPKLFSQDLYNQAIQIGSGKDLSLQQRESRAELLMKNVDLLNIQRFASVKDVANGHPRLNFCFVASLFNSNIGIHLPSEDEIRALYAKIEDLNQEIQNLNCYSAKEIQSLKEQIEVSQRHMQKEKQEILASHENQISIINQQNEALKADCENIVKRKEETAQKEIEVMKESFESEKTNIIKSNAEKIATQEAELENFKEELLQLYKSTIEAFAPTDGNSSSRAFTIPDTKDTKELLNQIKKMTLELFEENSKLNHKVFILSTTMEQKDKLNNVMGIKIKEFSEDLIKSKKDKKK